MHSSEVGGVVQPGNGKTGLAALTRSWPGVGRIATAVLSFKEKCECSNCPGVLWTAKGFRGTVFGFYGK